MKPSSGKGAQMKVPFRDLRVSDPDQKARLLEAVDRVLTHGRLLMGPEVEVFEQKIARFCGMRYCVGMSSGTDALYLALRSLDIGPGNQVITTPMSWIATLNAIHLCGAEPVFVDIADDLNINAELIESAITPRTKAIVPVHYAGRICDMQKILAVARKHQLRVVEDAAQAFGARKDGVAAGGFGDANAFSINPMKVLAGYGETGAVTTNDAKAHEKLLALRYLGTVNREICYYPSLNAKIDTLQAAMITVSLDYLEANIRRRIEIAHSYCNELKGTVGCPPLPPEGARSCVFFDFQIVAERRDELKSFLEAAGVEVKIKHPLLMPDQPAYGHLPRPSVPKADWLVKRILCLPIHEKLNEEQLHYVVERVKAFYSNKS